jgi:hypothetical protein
MAIHDPRHLFFLCRHSYMHIHLPLWICTDVSLSTSTLPITKRITPLNLEKKIWTPTEGKELNPGEYVPPQGTQSGDLHSYCVWFSFCKVFVLPTNRTPTKRARSLIFPALWTQLFCFQLFLINKNRETFYSWFNGYKEIGRFYSCFN